jgi:YggT family protein
VSRQEQVLRAFPFGKKLSKRCSRIRDSPEIPGAAAAMYNPIVWLLLKLIDLYTWVVIIAVVMSWLVAFNVINIHNQLARSIVQTLDAVTEPVFRQVRRVIPPIGGLDISPLIVLIALEFLSYAIVYFFPPNAIRYY